MNTFNSKYVLLLYLQQHSESSSKDRYICLYHMLNLGNTDIVNFGVSLPMLYTLSNCVYVATILSLIVFATQHAVSNCVRYTACCV